MHLTKEQVTKALQHGAAKAVDAAMSEKHLITEQINIGLDDNDVKKVQYTVDLHVKVTVDVETKKIRAKGGYGAKTANLSKWGNEVEMEIDDPNQPPLFREVNEEAFDNTAPIESDDDDHEDGDEILLGDDE